MDLEKQAELSRLAAELLELSEAARAVGEPFLAYLIEMAMLEAHAGGQAAHAAAGTSLRTQAGPH